MVEERRQGTWEGKVTAEITDLKKEMGNVAECLEHHGKTLQQINSTMFDMTGKWQASHDSQLRVEGKIESLCMRAENAEKKVDVHEKEHVWWTGKGLVKIGMAISTVPILGGFVAWIFKFWPFSVFK